MQADNYHSLTIVLAKPDANTIRKLADILGGIAGLTIIGIQMLSPDTAIDLQIMPTRKLSKTIEHLLHIHNIKADFCIQPHKDRKKKLLICDMDSTLIGQECIDELADFAGVKAQVSEITERAMRGEIDFEIALKERVGLLKGLPLTELQTCFDQRITLNSGAKTLCQTMKANGAKTVIVSGGFTFFTSRIATLSGFEHHHANTLTEDGDRLSGKVGYPILGRDAKKTSLIKYSQDLGGAHHAIAIGDGANDLAMITASGLGIAYRAKPIVAKAAHCAINHTDLTTALYFQGYRDDDFIEA